MLVERMNFSFLSVSRISHVLGSDGSLGGFLLIAFL